MANYRTPGVYIEEISKFPPSVAQVETAIPAFIGYTEKALGKPTDPFPREAVRISSLADYDQIFGGPYKETFSATFEVVNREEQFTAAGAPVEPKLVYQMYYSLQMYFANGGGPCYIVSTGFYTADPTNTPPAIDVTKLEAGLALLRKEDEPTLIVFPDAVAIKGSDDGDTYAKFYGLYDKALAECELLKDRFTIVDVLQGNEDFLKPGGVDVIRGATNSLRSRIGTASLKYGAAYYPWLETTLDYAYDPTKVTIGGQLPNGAGAGAAVASGMVLRLPESAADKSKSLYHVNNRAYQKVVAGIEKFNVVLPPSGFVVGIYARVDNNRGVWKAPANESLSNVNKPTVKINDERNDILNVDATGKSVNAIRSFIGKGTLIWGARTLDGNSNEWRYVSVRRFFNMVEESTKKATERFVFEPNDANTWVKVRAMIENFLIQMWNAGALQGSTPEKAFYVKVGLGETMTALDILEGRMNVEIGMAVVRPAEFIILKFSHKMPEA